LAEPPPEYTDKISIKDSSKSDKSKSDKSKSDNASTKSSTNSARPGARRRRGTGSSYSISLASDDDRPEQVREADWGIGDDARMGLE
jgi:hypothetical protein